MTSGEVVLGIDIGGTNTVLGVVDREGKCYFEFSIPTNAEEAADQLFDRLFKKFINEFDAKDRNLVIKGIGVGAPNANYFTSSVVNPPNLNWGSVNIADMVKNYIHLPVAVTNDANAAALGEKMFGVAKNYKNFVMITLGTGLGSGIVVNDELVYGHDGFAGELGHVMIKDGGRMCGCGKKGCLETYVSAPGIKRTVFELVGEYNGKDTVFNDITYKDLTSKIICEEALKGDHIAIKAFDKTAKWLGYTLANTVALLSPEAIVLFGGLSKAGDLLAKPTKQYMEEKLLYIFKDKIEIVLSGLDEDNVAVLGAAALIWNELDRKNCK